MNPFFLCFLLLAHLFSFTFCELLLVAEIFRHGARTPLKFAYKPSQHTLGPGELTALGMRQHLLLGSTLRKRYIEDLRFLSSNYSSSELYVKSSWKSRCYKSLVAHLYGFYPELADQAIVQLFTANNTAPDTLPLPDHVQVFTVTQDKDYFFHGNDGDTCPIAEEIEEMIKNSPLYSNKDLFYKLLLYEEIAQIVNLGDTTLNLHHTELNLKKVKQIYDVYKCNIFDGKDAPMFTESTLQHLHDIHKFIFYEIENGDYISSALAVSQLYSELADFFYNKAASIENVGYKMLMYSAHDKNLAALFSTLLTKEELHNFDEAIPPFAANVVFELHRMEKEDSEKAQGWKTYHVKIIYNGFEILLKKCGREVCKLGRFLEILDEYILHDIELACQTSFASFDISRHKKKQAALIV